MCKVFAIAGVSAHNHRKVKAFLKAITPLMTERDKDGFGYACVTRGGKLFGEKWRWPADAWVLGDQKAPAELEGALEVETRKYSYVQIGTVQSSWQNVCSVIAHARMSTCGLSLANVHPFVRDGVALIHNGVVHGNLDTSGSSGCDSAGILNAYVKGGVDTDPARLTQALADVHGWYACAVLGLGLDGAPYLDVFKDSETTDLTLSVVPGIGQVWCTKAAFVYQAAEKLGITVESSHEVKAEKITRLDARSGKVISITPFTPSKMMITSGGKGKGWDGESAYTAMRAAADYETWWEKQVNAPAAKAAKVLRSKRKSYQRTLAEIYADEGK